jgi:hypothetical protein
MHAPFLIFKKKFDFPLTFPAISHLHGTGWFEEKNQFGGAVWTGGVYELVEPAGFIGSGTVLLTLLQITRDSLPEASKH